MATRIDVRAYLDTLGGTTPAAGLLTATASLVRVAADVVTIPAPLTVEVVDGQPVEPILLEPTTAAWFWSLRLALVGGTTIRRNVSVPDVVAVAWGDLVDVNPSTFAPLVPVPPSTQQLLAGIPATVAGAVAAELAANPLGSAYLDPANLHIMRVPTVAAPAAAPTITTQPTDVTIAEGSSVTFTAAASGNPTPTAQWQVSADAGATWANLTGETAATLVRVVALADSGKRYRAVFTNATGTATTTAVLLTVNQLAPLVTVQPADATVASGATATFTFTATSDTTPAVQWQTSADAGVTWANISGATSASYATPTTDAAHLSRYRAALTNSHGTTYTAAATLTVTGRIPKVLVPISGTSVDVTNSVTTGVKVVNVFDPARVSDWVMFNEGDGSNPTYEFLTETALGSGTFVAVTTGTIRTSGTAAARRVWLEGYTTPTLAAGSIMLFRVKLTTGNGTVTMGSFSVKLQLKNALATAPGISVHPATQSVVAGVNASLSVDSTGEPRTSAAWEVSTDGGVTWTARAGGTVSLPNTAGLSLGIQTLADSGKRYRAVVTNSAGTVTTNAAIITVTS